jgi:hypothetical protein
LPDPAAARRALLEGERREGAPGRLGPALPRANGGREGAPGPPGARAAGGRRERERRVGWDQHRSAPGADAPCHLRDRREGGVARRRRERGEGAHAVEREREVPGTVWSGRCRRERG